MYKWKNYLALVMTSISPCDAAGVTIHRPEEVGTTSLPAPRKRKNNTGQEAVLEYLKESVAETLGYDQRKLVERMFSAILEKKYGR